MIPFKEIIQEALMDYRAWFHEETELDITQKARIEKALFWLSSLDDTESEIQVNFTLSDIEELQEAIQRVMEGGQEKVFSWTFPDQYGVMFNIQISVGDDEMDSYDQDDIDDIVDECPSCHGDGYVSITYEDSKGRDMETEEKCQDDWHNEQNF